MRKKRKNEKDKLKGDMQIKLQPKITFNSAEKCKTFDVKCQRARWSTDNSFNFHLFLKRMLWLFILLYKISKEDKQNLSNQTKRERIV